MTDNVRPQPGHDARNATPVAAAPTAVGFHEEEKSLVKKGGDPIAKSLARTTVFLLKHAFLMMIVLLSVLPILWVLLSSLKTNAEIVTTAFGLPAIPQWQNYVNAMKIAPIPIFYRNSIIVAVTGTVLNLFIIGMSSYVLARFEFRFKTVVTILLSLTLFLPASSLLQPLFVTISKLHLYDSLGALVLVYTGFGIPLTLYILRSYYLTIPRAIEECAFLDGAGFARTYFTIVVPLAKPAFASAAVLQFLLCWNEFTFALVLTTGTKNRTLPLALGYFTSQFASNYGAMFAAVCIMIVPSILVYVLMQEQVVSGLAAGAVKG